MYVGLDTIQTVEYVRTVSKEHTRVNLDRTHAHLAHLVPPHLAQQPLIYQNAVSLSSNFFKDNLVD